MKVRTLALLALLALTAAACGQSPTAPENASQTETMASGGMGSGH